MLSLHRIRSRSISGPSSLRGFTMIELMVVIGISALLLTTAMPSLYRRLDKDSMQKAVSDMLEAFSHARAHAILNGTIMAVDIHIVDGNFKVTPAYVGGSISTSGDNPSSNTGAEPGATSSDSGTSLALPPSGNSGIFSFKLSPSIRIAEIGVNGEDWGNDEEVLVRFFPNGTADELSLLLVSDKGEQRVISVEVVTGLADVRPR